MMATYFAEIKNNIVVRVIVATQEVINKNYTGEWVETKIDNSIRKQYAGVGMTYNKSKDKFIHKRPYPSWILDENDDWQPPIPRPNIGIQRWDESTKKWIRLDDE